jgi:hypothetical protein
LKPRDRYLGRCDPRVLRPDRLRERGKRGRRNPKP